MSEDHKEKDENIDRPGSLGERVLIQDWENLDFDARSVINLLYDLGEDPLGSQLSHI